MYLQSLYLQSLYLHEYIYVYTAEVFIIYIDRMIDRNQVRDRTLILRVLVPSLQVELQDKMAKREEEAVIAATEAAEKHAAKEAEMMAERSGGLHNMMMIPPSASSSSSSSPMISKEGQVLDLDGVTCEPTENASTLWNFHCDGATYPARLVNLPCPIEVMKTHDHSIYHKCTDIAQLLIVYEDMMSLEEAESSSGYKLEGFPSYYHSGITPPMKRVVERRFQAREHKAVAPPKHEVMDVEKELQNLIESISKDPSKTKGNKGKGGKGKSSTSKKNSASSASSTNVNKIIEDIEEEIVDYEPWMDDYGRQPYGIEFDEKDVMCTKHPELWLDHRDETEAAKAAEMAEAKKKEERKEKKKKKSGAVDAPTLLPPSTDKTNSNTTSNNATANNTTTSSSNTKKPESSSKKEKSKKEDGGKKKSKKKKNKEKESSNNNNNNSSDRKKGIAAKKTRDEIDEVTKIATQIARMDNNDDEEQLLLEGDFFDFAGDDAFETFDF